MAVRRVISQASKETPATMNSVKGRPSKNPPPK
jgi:hypothetical protein